MTIRVAVADDHALIRGSFRLLVENAPDLTVVGEAATGKEAIDLAARERPDVMLMDIRMPELDGIQATKHITELDNTIRVLILTTFDLDEYVYAALRAGASGFLLKEASPEDLLTAIRVIAAGDALIAPSVTRRLIADFARRQPPHPPEDRLSGVTDREREVLILIGRGFSNIEITETLHISLTTTKTHVSHLLTKLDARDRTQLVIAAYESGLVHIN